MRKSLFNHYVTALRAEHIKKKGTGIYVLSALLGLAFPALLCVISIFRQPDLSGPFEFSYYMKFIQDAGAALLVFFLPLLLIVMTSRVAQLDHRNGGWQLMETQPIPKFSLYFAKFTVVFNSLVIAVLAHLAGGLLFGWVASEFIEIPDNALMDIPWREMVQLGSRTIVAGLYIAALQFVLAVLMPSFIWAIFLGFGLLLSGVFIKLYGYHFDWYPFHIMSRINDFKGGSDLGHWFVFTEYVSVCAALVLLYIGFQWYRHKGWYRAFFAKPARSLALVAVLVAATAAGILLLRPKTGGTYAKTVLAGRMESAFNIQYVYVINPSLEDTLAVIPVGDNTFHYVFDEPPVADYYRVAFDRYFSTWVFFGAQDSVYIDGEANTQASRYAVTGTRLADTRAPQPSEAGNRIGYFVQENIYLDNPSQFSQTMYNDWQRSLKESVRFKTVDNLTPKSDFTEVQQKLMAVNYLNYWTDYVRKREAAFPDEGTAMPPPIEEIRSQVSLDDEMLLSYPAYRRYVADQHLPADTADRPYWELALQGVASLPEGRFRDKLLYSQLAVALEEASDGTERSALLARYGSTFADTAYGHRAENVYAKWQRLGKGEAAPLFDATDLAGNAVSWTDLQGQPVLVDVWATWCAPCKVQSPHFERLATKYKDEPIQFVSLNVDRDRSKWEVDAKMGSKLVKQWRAIDIDRFAEIYNTSTIPRFILIDAQGKFLSAQMPMPSEDTFEMIVRNTLGLAD